MVSGVATVGKSYQFNFQKWHREMQQLTHTLMSKRFGKIHPSLQKLIVSLGTAVIDDWKLDKQHRLMIFLIYSDSRFATMSLQRISDYAVVLKNHSIHLCYLSSLIALTSKYDKLLVHEKKRIIRRPRHPIYCPIIPIIPSIGFSPVIGKHIGMLIMCSISASVILPPSPSFHPFHPCLHQASVASSYPSSYSESHYHLLPRQYHWLNQTCPTLIQVIHWGKYRLSA
jgi:hypothetical protein